VLRSWVLLSVVTVTIFTYPLDTPLLSMSAKHQNFFFFKYAIVWAAVIWQPTATWTMQCGAAACKRSWLTSPICQIFSPQVLLPRLPNCILQSMLNNLPTSALALPEHVWVISRVWRASSGQTALDSIKCIPLTSERLDLKCKVTRADCKSMQTTKAQSENAKCWVSSYVLSAHPCITSTGPVIHRLLEVQAAFQDCTFRITQSS
jgi:hypothetical protein